MSILSPLFLLGGLALSLPLWLHLLQRQNPIRLRFSSLMFFERRRQSSMLQRRFRYLLLLAARLSLCLLLALAFARLVWERPPRAALSGLPTLHLIALDTSLSMNFGDRWENAAGQAEAIVDGMAGADLAQIIASGPGVRLASERTADRDELKEAIRSLRPTNSRNSYGELVEAIRNLIPEKSVPVEVHMISDFQHSAMPSRFSDVALPTIASLVVHDVTKPEAPNWAIESIKGSTRLFGGQQPRIEVTVAGFGTAKARKRVTLTLDGKQVGSESVDVPASGRASVVFENFEVPKGTSRGTVTLEPGDGLKSDDQRLVAFNNSEPATILFIYSQNRRRDALYYKAALDAGSGGVFQVQAASAGELGRLAPERFALVVISDIPRLSTLFAERLRKYVESGGSVLLAVGPKITLAKEAPLYSNKIGEARYAARNGERFQVVGEIDASHPVLDQVERFRRVKFFRYAQLWTGEDDDVLARLTDRSPLLVEEKIGDGRLLVFASSLDNVWNDLPVHAVFVPFVVEAARYLSGIDDSRLQATIDSVLELRKRRAPESTVQVFDPKGERALSLSESISGQDFEVSQVGFYEIRRTGESELVAVNPDPRESDLRPMDADTLALWKATGRRQGEAAGAGDSETAVQLPPLEVWRWLLALLLLVTLIESILGNVHLKVRREVRLS